MIIPDTSKVLLRSFGTHDGTFHADEVTACAFLLVCNLIDSDKIFRSRDLELLRDCEYVCDVGGLFSCEKKRFDHHQIDYRGSMSSAGMVLEHLKNIGQFTAKEYDFLNSSLVMGVDAHDNGKDPQILGLCSFSHIISNFMPITYETTHEEQTCAFMRAVDFAKGHIQRLLQRYYYNQSCRKEVAEAMATFKNCLQFERSLPWLDIFFELDGENHPASFVIMPAGKNWKLRGIPPSLEERMKVRVFLPEEWAGLLDEELKKVCGIEGALFCHKGRFISVWQTKEAALQALDIIL